MEDRTCPFCGGTQSNSRCEICGRPTVKIQTAARPVVCTPQPRLTQHTFTVRHQGKTPHQTNVSKKQIAQERAKERASRQQKQAQAMHIANVVAFLIFFIFLLMLIFLAV